MEQLIFLWIDYSKTIPHWLFNQKHIIKSFPKKRKEKEWKALPSFDGGGIDAIIFSNWFRVELPGKSGWPSKISPKIHPRLHMSTPLVYLERFKGNIVRYIV